MPEPDAPPKLLATTAMVCPSADSFTRYQFSVTGVVAVEVVTLTLVADQLAPASVDRNISPACVTATRVAPAAALSMLREGCVAVAPGSVGSVQVVAPFGLTTSRPLGRSAAFGF